MSDRRATTQRLASELRVVIGKIRRRLREQTTHGELTWAQVSVLNRLDSLGPTTVTALAREEGMRPQSMGAIVSVLVEERLLSKSPDPTDGRQSVVAITDLGRAWVADRRMEREDWLSRSIEKNLSATERTELERALQLLSRLVEASQEGRSE